MTNDPKKIVADGYDQIAERYLAWSALNPSPVRMRHLAQLLDLLPGGAEILELGCGAGVPVTQALAERGHVTGVDISGEQIALAERLVPDATFIQADMTELDFPAESFDTVVGFYTLIHIPRDEHASLLERIGAWLRPGGLLFVTMGASDSPDSVEPEWLGAPMFFSHYDAEKNRDLVERAGFEIVSAEISEEDENGELIAFLWVAARKS